MSFDAYIKVVSELQRGRKGSGRRKVANNTYLHVPAGWQYGEPVYLRLHATDILTFDPEGVTYNSGGWQTSTTKDRLNSYGPVSISQRNHVWYVVGPYDPANGWTERGIYADGMRSTYDGQEVSGMAQPSQVDADKVLDKRIRAYAKLCADSLPLDDPSGGDCWGCYFRAQSSDDVEPFGNDHYLEHMEEGYVVPSLVWNATVARGYGNGSVVWQMRMGRPDDWARKSVARDVRRYLRNRLGTIRSAESQGTGFAVR